MKALRRAHITFEKYTKDHSRLKFTQWLDEAHFAWLRDTGKSWFLIFQNLHYSIFIDFMHLGGAYISR